MAHKFHVSRVCLLFGELLGVLPMRILGIQGLEGIEVQARMIREAGYGLLQWVLAMVKYYEAGPSSAFRVASHWVSGSIVS